MDCLECLYLRTTKKHAKRRVSPAVGYVSPVPFVRSLPPRTDGMLANFCAEHQIPSPKGQIPSPKGQIPSPKGELTIDESPVQRYGYYLARRAVRREIQDHGETKIVTVHEEQFYGAEGYALAGRDLFIFHGLNPEQAGPYDGCSVHFDREGKKSVLITAQNFFSEKFSVYVHEVK